MIKFNLVIIFSYSILAGLLFNENQILKEQSSNDEIVWSCKKLKWSDFAGDIPEAIGITIAETQCRIRITDSRWVDGVPKFQVKCFFVKSESWTVVDDSMTLNHEQLHFDIYELFTRKLRKRFEELNLKGDKDPENYNQAYRELVNAAIIKNQDYDKEVYFNDKNQLIWIQNITNELEGLKAYEDVLED